MTTEARASASIFGALLADGAALGLHWIYDPARIAQIEAAQGGVAFLPIEKANYEGVPAYFAHGARQSGMGSQYGEALRLVLDSLQASPGRFDVQDYQNRFLAAFDMGGSYHGYIDKPTRGTVENIRAGQTAPSGIMDDQHPALARLPALVALGRDAAELRASIEVTNCHEDALAYGAVFADLLGRVMAAEPLPDALRASAEAAPEEAKRRLLAALDTEEVDSTTYGAITERACHLKQGMPLGFHILSHAQSYRDAVERNIRAGGDSCGRALLIGAVMGAREGWGGMPEEWIASLQGADRLRQQCEALERLPA